MTIEQSLLMLAILTIISLYFVGLIISGSSLVIESLKEKEKMIAPSPEKKGFNYSDIQAIAELYNENEKVPSAEDLELIAKSRDDFNEKLKEKCPYIVLDGKEYFYVQKLVHSAAGIKDEKGYHEFAFPFTDGSFYSEKMADNGVKIVTCDNRSIRSCDCVAIIISIRELINFRKMVNEEADKKRSDCKIKNEAFSAYGKLAKAISKQNKIEL